MRQLKYITLFLILILVSFKGLAQDTSDTIPIPRQPPAPHISMEPIETVSLGQSFLMRIQMRSPSLRLLPNLPILVYLDKVFIRRVRTDENGVAEVWINADEVGEYHVTAEFIGTQAYAQVSQTTSATVRPANVSVQTVPSIPDLKFQLGGRTFKSDENGLAQIEVIKVGSYKLEALPLENNTVDESTQAEFQRWNDSTFTSERIINVRGDKQYQAGYIISHLVQQTFSDLEGKGVAEERVDTLTLKTSTGDFYTFDDGQFRWLRSTRINRNRTGLEATDIQYSIESVNIDGSNTVNKYQQKFLVNPDDTWNIELLLYYAEIQAYDAVFGFPVGTGINLEYPDGRIEFLPYGPDNIVSIGPMARGTYIVEPIGVGGMKNATPVALSRFQNVRLKVVTYLDIGLALLLGASGAIIPLLYGRPHLIKFPIIIWQDAKKLQAIFRSRNQLIWRWLY